MAIPKITHKEEEVLLSMGLLEYPLSPLTLQEMVLLDGPTSPSDCLIPVCERWSLAPFVGSSSPKPELSMPVPTNPSVELGSNVPPMHKVPESIAPKSFSLISSDWECLPKMKEVTAPSIIEFKSCEKEEFDPSTGKVTRIRVIYPIITPRYKENSCISVPPLLESVGQLNSLTSCPSAVRSVCVDGMSPTITISRSPPTPRIDQVKPAPGAQTQDAAILNGAAPPPLLMTPGQSSSPTACSPSAPPVQITLGSPRVVMPPPLRLQADSSVDTRWSPAPSRASLCNSPLSPSCHSLFDMGVKEEEGQFDDAEEGETCEPLKLHPSKQPLLPSPSPSLSPSSSPSQVNQMVQCILLTKRQTSEVSAGSVSPGTAVSPLEAPKCLPGKGPDDVSLLDTPAQKDSLNALSTSSLGSERLKEPSPLVYTQLPPNAGRGTLIKCLFAPNGAFAAPRMVCPPQAPKMSVMACNAPGPLPVPSLLPRMYIRPMTMDIDRPSSPSPVNTPIQAALNRVTSPKCKSSIPSEQPIPKDLTLPKPYSTPIPLPRTSPVTPVLDETPVVPAPSPMDSENSLPLNSIPVAKLLNAHLPEDVSLMLIILSGPGLNESGTAMKLLMSAPKLLRRHYGWS